MPLGYRNNSTWRDMSEFVVHFTKDGDRTAFEQMMSIFWSRTLVASTTFGVARHLVAPAVTQASVCFSEVPLDRLRRLVERRSQYGVGFRQELLVRAGGGRVWYVDKDSPLAAAVQALVKEKIGPPMDRHSELWQLTPYIDLPGEYDGTEYRFEWEREWRVPGGLHFDVADVAFLFLPEAEHDRARTFFEETKREHSGPAYDCPFLDPLWDDERIQDALSELP